ncbi:TorF family putative porin [Dyella nitratireducens]|uniref:TorF family putative porin n=1 Tax=Dyella nitratireducens TaxID=1849580 RepID=UPI0016691493|nr:TorF family putative porin [Dyella nitratireducens]
MAVLVALLAVQARAQVTGSATFVSDYRFRGTSLSDDRPAAQLAFDADWPSTGWYAGGMMSNVRLDSSHAAQLLGYAGYVRRLNADLSWEGGVRYTRFTGGESYAYAEAYTGLTFRQLVGRIYYAPNYFNAGYATWYAELNDSIALSGKWYAFAHAGYLRRAGDVAEYHVSRFRSDVRAGIGLTLQPWDIQLSWTTAHGAPDVALGYPSAAGTSRNAWVFSVAYAW